MRREPGFPASAVSRLPHVSPPVLTAYLDVNPANPRNQSTPRGYVKWLKSTGKAISKDLPGSERKALATQLGRISRHLETTLPRSRGLLIVAGPQTWEEIPLQVEVTEELHWGKPSLQQMAWILDEHRLRGAVVIDGSGARFFRFWLGTIAEDPPFAFSLDISSWRKPHLVGPSTRGVPKRDGVERDRIASRVAEQRRHFLRRLSARIVDWVKEAEISPVVLVGDIAEIGAVIDTVPAELRARMAALPKTLPRVSPSEAGRKLQSALNRWEREYEAALVKEMISGQASRQSVMGLAETLNQLQAGQVRELVVARGVSGSVRQCINCGWVDRSADADCPICGVQRQLRNVRTILPELAVSHSVPIEVVAGAAAGELRSAGGIGAWLRTARVPSKRKTNIPVLSPG